MQLSNERKSEAIIVNLRPGFGLYHAQNRWTIKGCETTSIVYDWQCRIYYEQGLK